MLPGYEYEVVRYESGGIKCDTKGCDWHDDTVLSIDYLDWVNKPCPDCDGNLLTEADHIATINLGSHVIKINLWCNKWLPIWLLKLLSSGTTVTSYEMNGDGVLRRKK